MKKLFPLITALLFTAGCATVHHLDSTKCDVIPVPQVLQNTNAMQEVMQRIENGGFAIFKVANGERMPLKLTVDLPIGALEKNDYTFDFKHDTYFLISRKGLRLSPDGQRWADFTSRGAEEGVRFQAWAVHVQLHLDDQRAAVHERGHQGEVSRQGPRAGTRPTRRR